MNQSDETRKKRIAPIGVGVFFACCLALGFGMGSASGIITPIYVWDYHAVGGDDLYHCAGLGNGLAVYDSDQMSTAGVTYGRKQGLCSQLWQRPYNNMMANVKLYWLNGAVWVPCGSTYTDLNDANTSEAVASGLPFKCAGGPHDYFVYTEHTSYGFSTTGTNVLGYVEA